MFALPIRGDNGHRNAVGTAVELRPPVPVSKGTAVRRLLGTGGRDRARAAHRPLPGDDLTDRTGFAAVHEWAAEAGERLALAVAALTDETPPEVRDEADVVVAATPGVGRGVGRAARGALRLGAQRSHARLSGDDEVAHRPRRRSPERSAPRPGPVPPRTRSPSRAAARAGARAGRRSGPERRRRSPARDRAARRDGSHGGSSRRPAPRSEGRGRRACPSQRKVSGWRR